MAKKTWAERWGESPVDYTRSIQALSKELKKIRNLTARRIASLKKGKAYSYAAYQYEQSMQKTYLKGMQPNVSQMSYQQLERELRMHHQFWASKTATQKGAKEELYRQSSAIFGTTKSGRPSRLMTLEEGRAFWSAYHEFYNMYKDSTAKYDSNRLQRVIGAALDARDFNNVDMTKLLADARKAMEEDFDNPFETSLDIARRMEALKGNGNDFEL